MMKGLQAERPQTVKAGRSRLKACLQDQVSYSYDILSHVRGVSDSVRYNFCLALSSAAPNH